MEEATVARWQVSRGQTLIAMLGAAMFLLIGIILVFGMLLSGDALRLRTIPIPTSALFVLGFAFGLGRTTRYAWLQIATLAVTTVGLVLYVLHPPPDLPVGYAVTIGVIGSGLYGLVLTAHRLRTPIVLRLTESGIERGGYPYPTPPIPYAEIVRVDAIAESRLGLTLRGDWTTSGIERTWRGYDVAIGHDVGARISELRDLIVARLPDDAV